MTRTKADAAASFDPLRPRLVRIAYRMLGSVADAEDVVQEAFIRWLGTDREQVREPKGFLRRIVARLCLDVLKSAQRRRLTYVGPWLPEPLVADADDEIDDVTLPLMLALERLSPLERAAFLLHDVFGVEFDEIADTLGREAATVRKLAVRARDNLRAARRGHATRCRSSAVWRSQRHSSLPRATATCCRPRRWRSPTARSSRCTSPATRTSFDT
jgi:RNA polymerase sigma-70 factor (ECF subfamily)